MRKLILKSSQSPGDVLMLTAAVRDLHRAHPGKFQTDVRTTAPELWENNPHLTPLREGDAGVEMLDMHYPLVHHANHRPYHFIHGYLQYLEERLGVRIPATEFQGDVYLSPQEKEVPPGVPESFWIVVAGGKYDFTAKWWDPASYQKVVDAFRGRVHFVQCGEEGHWHPRLQGVTDLVGKTTIHQFVRLMYHAEGVLCPVTFAMHLAAAVPTKPGRPKHRAAVVVAGGREPTHWEAYPHHQFLHTLGALPCCADGGCWKSRCQLVGDGDAKDRSNLCQYPVQVSEKLRIPRCMEMIRPEDVIRRIELYYEREHAGTKPTGGRLPMTDVLIQFRHGLGDAVQLTAVLEHLRHYRPEWNVDVAALVGKHSAYHGLCREVFMLDHQTVPRSRYQKVFNLDWPECQTCYGDWPSTKVERCLLEVFGLQPVPELCRYVIRPRPSAIEAAKGYLESICPSGPKPNGRYPAVLIHYEGNTSGAEKNIPVDIVRMLCEDILEAGGVPVVLDWDRRSPLADGKQVHNPHANHPMWGGTGTGDAEVLAALIEQSSLMIGVDSGPLHVAGATTTPTLGVWTAHHPLHYFGHAENVLHLVPPNHLDLLRGEKPAGQAYFEQHYRRRTYQHLYVELSSLAENLLTGESLDTVVNRRFLRQLHATSYGEEYYWEHRQAGLDYLSYGQWQEQYGRWLAEALDLKGKRVLDVGCACGSILRGLGRAGAVVQGVDLSEAMIRMGRKQWPDMANLLLVADAVNLHCFRDCQWDVVHSAQVAEHWRPELVPFILRELRRVTMPDGLFFCALDTEELVTRQGRTPESEDPTHLCIRPMAWWHRQLADAGWEVCTSQYEPVLRNHPQNFLSRYDWDWFVARKIGGVPHREDMQEVRP